MSNTFFTSDEHHGHRNALLGWGNEQKARPFSSLEDMTEGLIDRHNAVVKSGDKVYHIGDMFWRAFGYQKALEVMIRLNGQHFYVLGNHEEIINGEEKGDGSMWSIMRGYFVWVKERAKISPDKALCPQGIILDHFAGRVWDGSHKGRWQLFGHSHGALDSEEPFLLSFDVGVDSNNYTPVSLEEAAKRMSERVDAKKYRDVLEKYHKGEESITS